MPARVPERFGNIHEREIVIGRPGSLLVDTRLRARPRFYPAFPTAKRILVNAIPARGFKFLSTSGAFEFYLWHMLVLLFI